MFNQIMPLVIGMLIGYSISGNIYTIVYKCIYIFKQYDITHLRFYYY